MPFHVRDPWRVQYFEGVPCPPDVHVPVDDIDCWEWFPQYRYVYDKLHVARSQGVVCGTVAEIPTNFPVFAKPRINLKGMGLHSGQIADAEAFAKLMSKDHMWMEVFNGLHVSTDCAVSQGQVKWIRHATGLAWRGGMFKHWIIHAADMQALETVLRSWIARELPLYTGLINIETIGNRIIEAQIRFADQWCDLNGTGWLEAVARLYASGTWDFDDSRRRDGFSIPLFMRHGTVPSFPPPQLQADIRARSGVSSLQLTYHLNKPAGEHPMPPGGFRLAIVNCWDLQAGFAARRDLAAAFPGVETIIPD